MIKLLSIYRYKTLFVMTTLLSVFALSTAYFTEYILGFAPCSLCIYQRIPYCVIIIFALLALMTEKFYRICITAIILAVIASIFISAYHTGVERKIFLPLNTCKNNIHIKTVKSFEEYKMLIENAKYLSCTEPAFRIFGFSMVEYNLIVNSILLLFMLIVLYKKSSYAET